MTILGLDELSRKWIFFHWSDQWSFISLAKIQIETTTIFRHLRKTVMHSRIENHRSIETRTWFRFRWPFKRWLHIFKIVGLSVFRSNVYANILYLSKLWNVSDFKINFGNPETSPADNDGSFWSSVWSICFWFVKIKREASRELLFADHNW